MELQKQGETLAQLRLRQRELAWTATQLQWAVIQTTKPLDLKRQYHASLYFSNVWSLIPLILKNRVHPEV